jgi:hypothetical protein
LFWKKTISESLRIWRAEIYLLLIAI